MRNTRSNSSAIIHYFDTTEIELVATASVSSVFGSERAELSVRATMRPRRSWRGLWAKNATDVAEHVALKAQFPLEGYWEPVIACQDNIRSISARRAYESNPFRQTEQLLVYYDIEVQYRGNPHSFSGELAVSGPPPQTD